MILWLAACAHHAEAPGEAAAWSHTTDRRSELVDGRWCEWESDTLRVGDQLVFGEAPPEPEQHWCTESHDRARWVEDVEADGPWLSAQTWVWDSPGLWVPGCATWSLVTARRATLDDVEGGAAGEAWAHAQAELARAWPGGWKLDRDAFLVGRGHVSFCAIRGREVALVKVR